MESKIRLDKLLFERDLTPSREKAQAIIMAGKVLVNNQKVDKPGVKVPFDIEIQLLGEAQPYVSRGGQKLEDALNSFAIETRGRIAMDVGASTGGFTDCLLQHGASYVFAVDVGYGQIDWKISQDPRVRSLERKNFRHLKLSDIGTFVDLIVIDVSFISLTKLLGNCIKFLVEGGALIALIKPQFEAGRDKVGKGGVVKDMAVHSNIIESIKENAQKHGFVSIQVKPSPIAGKKRKNIEYLIHLNKPITT